MMDKETAAALPRLRCRFCGMTFVIAEQPKHAKFGTCGEPRCRRSHWTSGTGNGRGASIVCGVRPDIEER